MLSVLVGPCWQGLRIHLGIYNTLKPELALNLTMRNRSSSSTTIKHIKKNCAPFKSLVTKALKCMNRFHFLRTRGPSNFRSNTEFTTIATIIFLLFSLLSNSDWGENPFQEPDWPQNAPLCSDLMMKWDQVFTLGRQEKKELHVTLNCKWNLHCFPHIFMDNFQHMGNCGSLHSSQCSNRQKVEKVQAAGWKAKRGKMRKAPDNKL